jgi:hypothetical protein
MQIPDRRNRSAVFVTLLACGVGWFLLPYAPGLMPGESQGRLALLQQLFTWWPLALLAAFVVGLSLPRLKAGSTARGVLLVLQWLLTLASVVLLVATLFEVFFPRPY